MSTEIFFSSNKLGTITDKQLQLVLDRFHLGELITSEKTANGVGNQTLFISSTAGEYVLKGNPLFAGQFIEEKFYVDNLLEITNLPVPSPYLVDESKDIFGWSYAIMPRLQGRHLNESGFAAALGRKDQEQIAELLAVTISKLHRWKVAQYGEFDPVTQKICPFKGSYKTWLYNRIRFWLKDAKQYSVITSTDIGWVEQLLTASEHVFHSLSSPTFVMGDFKPDNLLVQQGGEGWEISGIFDFTTGYFGDGIADLPRFVAMYLDDGKEALAKLFIRTYLHCMEAKDGFVERFRVHMLHQRVLDWGCAKATNDVTWDQDMPFSTWAERFTDFTAEWLS
ncbi:phosphotransferase family protein [Paenibacillus azoreducens]|uniref:Aminoglycoside phosphotransferase domain-containing protein n=1 Tax=Paenibacillus azoreducens TaxID=116718 RepID=A0A920CSN6_9BACL|nr:aminoglycoside phosphotransferase family protein [Paenibacillus azoreducens]GIO49480.1 hypothetical protein J34TS1_42450 [Paenibacillus azoreducens]